MRITRSLVTYILTLVLGNSIIAFADPVQLPAAPAPLPETMTVDKLELIVKRLDERYVRDGNVIRFSYGDQDINLITDPSADRMRVIIAIADAGALDKDLLYRIMQANFDSALDARYAIARGVLWSTFLHPLGSLTEMDFIMGVGQAINIVTSFGTTFSSGVFTFGGGDSDAIIQKELLEELIKRGLSI